MKKIASPNQLDKKNKKKKNQTSGGDQLKQVSGRTRNQADTSSSSSSSIALSTHPSSSAAGQLSPTSSDSLTHHHFRHNSDSVFVASTPGSASEMPVEATETGDNTNCVVPASTGGSMMAATDSLAELPGQKDSNTDHGSLIETVRMNWQASQSAAAPPAADEAARACSIAAKR